MVTKDHHSQAMVTKDNHSIIILPSRATGILPPSSIINTININSSHSSNITSSRSSNITKAAMLLEGMHQPRRRGHNNSAMALHRATHSSTVTVPESARRC